MDYPITPASVRLSVARTPHFPIFATGQNFIEQAPSGEVVKAAWKHSRPADTDVNLTDVMKIDVPVNEMEDFVLECHTPIIIREMLFSIRDHVAWARTSRVDNLMEWEVQHGYENDVEVRACYDMMLRLKETQSQDNYREMLPLVYYTHYTLKLSARTLMKFAAGVLDWLQDPSNPLNTGRGPLWQMMDELYKELRSVISHSCYAILPARQYGSMELFPKATRRGVQSEVVVVGGFVNLYFANLPIVLRAQIVRHRPITFRDTMFGYLNEASVTAPVNSKIAMEMVMPVEMALSMVRKRNCWIAQEDLWAPIIEALNAAIGDGDDFPLPCDGKTNCPVSRDNELRHGGKDPAPACPLWYYFERLQPSGEQRAAIMGYAEKRTISADWWRQTYNELIPDPGA